MKNVRRRNLKIRKTSFYLHQILWRGALYLTLFGFMLLLVSQNGEKMLQSVDTELEFLTNNLKYKN